jgi:hypothetical protein
VSTNTAAQNCNALLTLQLHAAERWESRGQSSSDPFAKFFFYFVGLNALYFAWAKADGIRNRQGAGAGETLQIQHLLRKLGPEIAERILRALPDEISLFRKRSPIQRMDKRTCVQFDSGDPSEGRRARDLLGEATQSLERLLALGAILYLVRSNLVHGSKAEAGDDRELIAAAVRPLALLLRASIDFTEAALSS